MKIKLNKEPAPEISRTVATVTSREYLDSIPGSINRYNIKTISDGKQYVIHCITGEAVERKDAQPLQDKRGNVMWIRAGESLSPLDRPILQQWKNPERIII